MNTKTIAAATIAAFLITGAAPAHAWSWEGAKAIGNFISGVFTNKLTATDYAGPMDRPNSFSTSTHARYVLPNSSKDRLRTLTAPGGRYLKVVGGNVEVRSIATNALLGIVPSGRRETLASDGYNPNDPNGGDNEPPTHGN